MMSVHGESPPEGAGLHDEPQPRERKPTEKGLLYKIEQSSKELTQIFRQLKIKSDRVSALISENDVNSVPEVQALYSEYLIDYENYITRDSDYSKLLSVDELEAYTNEQKLARDIFLKNFKVSVENWMQTASPEYNVRSSGGSRTSVKSEKSHRSLSSRESSLSSARMREEQKQVKLAVQLDAMKKRRELELAKLTLRMQEEEHMLQTEMAVSDAKSRVIEKYEKRDTEHVLPDTKPLLYGHTSTDQKDNAYELVKSEPIVKSSHKIVLNPSCPPFQPSQFNVVHDKTGIDNSLLGKKLQDNVNVAARSSVNGDVGMGVGLAEQEVSGSVHQSSVYGDSVPRSQENVLHTNRHERGCGKYDDQSRDVRFRDAGDQFGAAKGSDYGMQVNDTVAHAVHAGHVSPNDNYSFSGGNARYDVTTDVVRHLRKPNVELRKFGGNPMEFKKFLRQFEAQVSANTDSFEEKMNFLEQLTVGEANRVVSGFSHLDAVVGFPAAVKELTDRYGDNQVIAHAFIQKALQWPNIRPDDVQNLDEFALFLVECENAVRSIDALMVLEYSENMRKLVSKLPFFLHDRWRNVVQSVKARGEIVSFGQLVDFVKAEVKKSKDPVYGKDALVTVQRSGTTKNIKPPAINRQKGSFAATELGTLAPTDADKRQPAETQVDAISTHGTSSNHPKTSKVSPCAYCNKQSHKIDSCWAFSSLPFSARQDHMKVKGLCFGCMRYGHVRRNCRNLAACDTCKRKHPTVLHVGGQQPSHRSDESIKGDHKDGKTSGTSNLCSQIGSKDASCAMAIVPIHIRLKNKMHSVETFAFFDTGSSVSFCTDNLLLQLGVRGKQMRLTLDTMGFPHDMNTQVVNGLQAFDPESGQTVDLPKVYSKEKLPVSKEHIPTQKDIECWPHLRDIGLKQPDVEIGLMIGSNVPDAYAPFEVRTGPRGSPHATRTALGWVVWNVVRNGHNENSRPHTNDVVNRAEIMAIRVAEGLEQLNEKLRESFNVDFPERLSDDKRENSVDDAKFMEMANNSMCVIDGHYSMDLPFRNEAVVLPNNESLGHQRLGGLKRKMLNNPQFRDDYTDFMGKVIDKGYAEKIPQGEIERNDGRVWYIPHHGVYHPRKPNKIRVVFDCSASYQGISLNDQLLQGPDLANGLIAVLIRFRQEQIAIMGDVESMFFQVCVTPNDTDCLRFLWWPEGNLANEPVPYRMLVHLFGAVSSPTCANLALRRTADDNADHYDAQIVDTVKRNMYVDDLLFSTPTETEAISRIKGTAGLCAEGGFRLTKWVSNSRSVIESVPVEDRAKDVKEIDLDHGSLPCDRALGVFWSVETDMLGFRIQLSDHTCTRRGVLSVVSSMYDPLGLACPFVLSAKILLQNLCKLDLSWDDILPEKEAKVWQNWLDDVPQLESLQIPRCYKPPGFGEVKSSQIHTFCYASNIGYGVVAYLRLTNSQNVVHCSFLMGKSRVAPLKKITIPRLELTAATIAVRLNKVLTDELDYPIDTTYFWTDSMTVLRYLSNDSARFQTFVANRVAVIRDASHIDQWRHVDTKLNPADCATRGLSVSKLLQSKQWLNGPDFLWLEQEQWPQKKENTCVLSSDDPEVKSVANLSLLSDSHEDPVTRLVEYFSDWTRLRRALGWILCAMENLKRRVDLRKLPAVDSQTTKTQNRKCQVNHEKVLCLPPRFIEKAEVVLVKFAQRTGFPDNYNTNVRVKSKKLSKLDPVMTDGLLRVGGRLKEAHMTHDAKHPIILPKDSKVSKLILEHIHRNIGHLGKNAILAELRTRYWMIGAIDVIKTLLHRCVTCRRYQAKASEQKMANLPEGRLTPDDPPFTRTGQDYFGPFEVKRARSMVKRYGVIFTCLNTRAVHLEMAPSLDTDACINVLRRFIARRGPVKDIYSDNGTNLVGADRELRHEIEGWNKSKIGSFAAQQGITWHFNPPAASHFGGVWERLIRSVRKVLYSVVHEQVIKFDDDGLHTLLCEVESILNGRPLTEAPSSPNDLDVITPNHLLLLRPGESFPPGTFNATDNYARRRWKQIQYLADIFWARWTKEYLPLLQQRQKWLTPQRNIKVGDIVLIVDSSPRNSWCLGRVVEVMPDKAGLTRIAKSIWFTGLLVLVLNSKLYLAWLYTPR